MRIRKRQVSLFPLSSLSPPPLSDPHLIHRSPPLVQLDGALPPKQPLPASDHPPPSDRSLPPIRNPTDAWDSSRIATTQSGAHKQDLSDEDGRGPDGEGEKRNDTRKGGILGFHTTTEVLPPSSPPNNQDGRWCEGEKAMPLKKRRGSFERRGGEDSVYMTDPNNGNGNSKKMKTRMKTRMNKKCSSQNDNEEEETKASKKKGSRGGGVVMEGSRCSRVNGRGWRCCQQTLVGYSLCEHHLGKGRLRSMTSVRSRSIPANKNDSDSGSGHGSDPLWGASSSSPDEKQSKGDSLGIDNGEDKNEEKKKPLMTTKKRIGMVKARSISSLLGQTNTQITLPEINNK